MVCCKSLAEDEYKPYCWLGFGGRYVMDDANVPVSTPSPVLFTWDDSHRPPYVIALIVAISRILGKDQPSLHSDTETIALKEESILCTR